MALPRPTIQELIARAESGIASRLATGGPLLPRSTLSGIARAIAGGTHALYGAIAYLVRQGIPHTAEGEELEDWARDWGIPRLAATFAAGSVTFTGSEGATVPAGALLRRADGEEYSTDAEATISGGTATVALTATAAGVSGNAAAGVTLSLVAPASGVSSSATVAAGGIVGGLDREDDEALRARLLARIQTPPQGGAHADYIAWAKEVAGVTRAWVFEDWMGQIWTVGVTFAVDDDAGGPIPSSGQVDAVQAYIDEQDGQRRPVTADVAVFAPIEVLLDPEIQLDPDTTEVRAAVEASLAALLRREAEPGTTLRLSRIQEAISLAAGETSHVLVSPAADVVYAENELGTLGTPTWS